MAALTYRPRLAQPTASSRGNLGLDFRFTLANTEYGHLRITLVIPDLRRALSRVPVAPPRPVSRSSPAMPPCTLSLCNAFHFRPSPCRYVTVTRPLQSPQNSGLANQKRQDEAVRLTVSVCPDRPDGGSTNRPRPDGDEDGSGLGLGLLCVCKETGRNSPDDDYSRGRQRGRATIWML